jgi:hypothetical protein
MRRLARPGARPYVSRVVGGGAHGFRHAGEDPPSGPRRPGAAHLRDPRAARGLPRAAQPGAPGGDDRRQSRRARPHARGDRRAVSGGRRPAVYGGRPRGPHPARGAGARASRGLDLRGGLREHRPRGRRSPRRARDPHTGRAHGGDGGDRGGAAPGLCASRRGRRPAGARGPMDGLDAAVPPRARRVRQDGGHRRCGSHRGARRRDPAARLRLSGPGPLANAPRPARVT